MKKIKIETLSFVISIIFSLLGCNEKSSFTLYETLKGEEKLIKLEDIRFKKFPYADSIMTVEKVVVLESGKDNFIGTYDKINIIDDIIYIMDKSITYSIFAFDLDGKFLWKIAALGEGPEEYIELRDFTVSKDSETLDLLDYGGRKIMKFDKKTGELKEKVKFDRSVVFVAFEKIGDLYLFIHGNECGSLNECYNFTFLNKNLDVIKKNNPINKFLKSYDYSGFNHFSRNENNIFFTEIFNDTIYKVNINEKKLSAAYIIDFGKNKVPNDLLYSKQNESFMTIMRYVLENQAPYDIHDFYITKSYLFLRYGNPNLQNVIIDLKNNKSLSYRQTLIGNSFLHGEIKATYKNTFVKALSSEMIDKFLKEGFYGKDSLVFRERNPEFFEIIKDMDSSHNGILSFVNFNLN